MACPPTNVVGPFTQTKFLGASIVRYTSRIGWNGDTGTMEITLAEDKCDGTTKLYYDACGSPQTTTEVDAFNPPILGTPCYFRYGDFEFGGILKSWERQKSATGGTLFYVTLTDPMSILGGVKVILNNYTGETFGVPNLLNAYGYIENNPANCPTVTTGMDPALGYTAPVGFGNANESDAGLQWNQLRTALITMINSIPIVSASYGARVQLRNYNFFVDLTEVPILDSYFRMSGDSASLLDIISQVCEASGLDYFAELVYVTGLPGMPACSTDSDTDGHLDPLGVAAFIKIRTVSGYSAGATSLAGYIVDGGVDTAIDTRIDDGTIGDFVTDVEATESGAKQHRSGVELREAVTNAFLVGDSRQDLWQITQTVSPAGDGTDNLWQYWGLDDTNSPLVGTGLGMNHTVTIPVGTITAWGVEANNTTLQAQFPGGLAIKAVELLAAGDSFSSWLAYVGVVHDTEFAALSGFTELAGLKLGDFARAALDAGSKAKPMDILASALDPATNIHGWALEKDKIDPIRKWYDFVKGLADEFLGKKFLVKMPFTCAASDPNQPFTLKLNWIKNDAAWTDADVLGLTNASSGLEFFRVDDGRISCFLHYDGSGDKINFNRATQDDIWKIDDEEIYLRANFENIVYMDPSNVTDPRAVVTVQQPISTTKEHPDVPLHAALLVTLLVEGGKAEADAVTIAKEQLKKYSIDTTHHGLNILPLIPDGAAVPLRSATLSYGPWVSTIAAGPASETNYQRDTSMSPWGFGATATMNGAGAIGVESQVTNIVAVESGSVSVPGSPVTSLGRLLRVGGPTVTNIDVSVAKDEVSCSYRMRTWTPKFDDIGRRRIEALRASGTAQQKVQRAFIRNFSGRDNMGKPVSFAKAWAKELNRPDAFNRQTSHAWLGAETMEDHRNSSFRRDFGAITDWKKALPGIAATGTDEYKQKAGCEFTGVFRPFSTSKSDSYFADYSTPYNNTSTIDTTNVEFYSAYQVPPVSGEHHMPITCNTLNPFLDPNDSWLANMNPDNVSMNGPSGHDIDYVVRDGTFPADMNIAASDYSSSQWYRAIGLRAPLVLVGWGFDINNKPVPNKGSTGSEQMEFADDWLAKPHLWKAGPLDVRWDANRAVWTAAPPFAITKVRMMGHINPGETQHAIMYEEATQLDEDGANVETYSACSKTDQAVDVTLHGQYPAVRGSDVFVAYNNGDYDIISTEQQFVYGTTHECIAPGSNGSGAFVSYPTHHTACGSPSISVKNNMQQPMWSGQKFYGLIVNTDDDNDVLDVWVMQAEYKSLCVVTQVDCQDVEGTGDEQIVVCTREIYVDADYTSEDCGTDSGGNPVSITGGGTCGTGVLCEE